MIKCLRALSSALGGAAEIGGSHGESGSPGLSTYQNQLMDNSIVGKFTKR